MYEIGQLPDRIRALPVIAVRVIAHTMGSFVPGGQLSENHWSIFLLVPNGSVRLNMTLRYPSTNVDIGALGISELEFQHSLSATASWDFGVAQDAAVWHFTNSIVMHGRQNYRMAENGVDCRWWMYVIFLIVSNARASNNDTLDSL